MKIKQKILGSSFFAHEKSENNSSRSTKPDPRFYYNYKPSVSPRKSFAPHLVNFGSNQPPSPPVEYPLDPPAIEKNRKHDSLSEAVRSLPTFSQNDLNKSLNSLSYPTPTLQDQKPLMKTSDKTRNSLSHTFQPDGRTGTSSTRSSNTSYTKIPSPSLHHYNHNPVNHTGTRSSDSQNQEDYPPNISVLLSETKNINSIAQQKMLLKHYTLTTLHGKSSSTQTATDNESNSVLDGPIYSVAGASSGFQYSRDKIDVPETIPERPENKDAGQNYSRGNNTDQVGTDSEKTESGSKTRSKQDTAVQNGEVDTDSAKKHVNNISIQTDQDYEQTNTNNERQNYMTEEDTDYGADNVTTIEVSRLEGPTYLVDEKDHQPPSDRAPKKIKLIKRMSTFSSEDLTDLHVYIVPPEYWDDTHNCAFNTVMNFTTSVGFIRVYPETRLLDLRAVLIDQVTQSGGILPQQFVFLKSVGRALTLVKDQQEGQLKVKNFLPPFAYAPELFLMTRERLMAPGRRNKNPRNIPPLAQIPQHKYVPMHHSQQAAAAMHHNQVGYMPQGQPHYPPPSHQSQYRGGGGATGRGYQMDQFYGVPQQSMNPMMGGDYNSHYHQGPDQSNLRGRHFAGTPSMGNQYGRQPTMGYPTNRTGYRMQSQNVQDNRVFPPQSEFFPGYGGYQPAKRVGYPMDYGPPMSASPPETAMGPQGALYVDPVPLSMPPGQENHNGHIVHGMDTAGGMEDGSEFQNEEEDRPTTASSQSSAGKKAKSTSRSQHKKNEEQIAQMKELRKQEASLEEREKQLAKQERELERKKEEKERKLEEKRRKVEMEQEQALRDLEKRLAEQQRKLEDSKYQMERELQEQKDRQEKAMNDMTRNIERMKHEAEMEQQQEVFKQQKEMDDLLREKEKAFNAKRQQMEKEIREQEAQLRQKLSEEERKLADKERDIERAKMELEKQQLEKEKDSMQKQNFIQKAKMEMKREKARLAKEEKEQLKTERENAISRQGQMNAEGDTSRPGSSPPKMKFPRAKTPDLLEEFQKKLQELARIKEERKEIELVQEDLVRKALSVQVKATQKRAQARDNWKKQYFEEKRKTAPLEEHATKLRREVDNLNRRVITRLEKEADAQQDHNQQLSSQHKIVFMKLQFELEDTKQRIEEMQLKLLGEVKRRLQCSRETRCLHRELKQTRVTANLMPPNSLSTPNDNEANTN
ncbi:uncharacterized protein LOC134839149 isoform X4 [Symsagittifera roscoffensis]|uniref:uncharacterized protein LOC134839149 isoform X4 n=1 Tax=Symsagittifera roscoffensis TaxID=84072 RepID=UPI00307CC473